MRYNTALKIEDLFPERSDGLCRRCQKTLTGKQRKWCSKECSNAAFDEMMFAKGSSTHIRSALFSRDKGICASCGIDCEKVQRISDAAYRSLFDYMFERLDKALPIIKTSSIQEHIERIRARDKFESDFYKSARSLWDSTPLSFGLSCWEADHILEVINGGSHTLENLQTLCIACHKEKTRQLAKSRTKQRAERKPLPLFETVSD